MKLNRMELKSGQHKLIPGIKQASLNMLSKEIPLQFFSSGLLRFNKP